MARFEHQLSRLGNSEAAQSDSMLLTRRDILQLGVGAAVTFGIAACTGTSSQAGTQSGPRTGGTLHLAVTDAIANEKLDPGLSLTANDAVYSGAMFENLVATDLMWNLSPVLATAWKADATASQWTITLRQGVKFHDGTQMTANDVVFSLQRHLDKSYGSGLYARLSPSLDPSGVIAQGDHTVVLNLKRSDALIMQALTERWAKVVKAGTTDFTQSSAVGTGPFKLKSWTPAQQWAVVRNPDYWQSGLPYLDGIQAVVIPDQSTKLQAVLSGDQDVGDAINLASLTQVAASSNAKIVTIPAYEAIVFAMDQSKPPFNDLRLVKALKLATDRNALLSAAFQGHGSITADVPVPLDDPFFPPSLSTGQDIAQAKQLLAEAGFPNGFDITLNTSDVEAGVVAIATALQQVVKPAGININLQQWPSSSYWNKAWLQTTFFQDYWGHRHPVDSLALFYASDAVWNEASNKDSTMDQMIQQVMSTPDPVAQKPLIEQALLRAHDNFGYIISVWSSANWVVKNRVQGVELNYTDHASFKQAYLSA